MTPEQENLENNIKARFWYHAYLVAKYQREQLREDRDNLLVEVKKLRKILSERSDPPILPERGAAPSHGGVAPSRGGGK